MPPLLIPILHLLSTVMLTGLIWFVQVVHYPLLREVGEAEFVGYERIHVRRTGRVVGPLMLVEGATAIWLAVTPGGTLAWVGAALLAAIWISTFLLQVPLHRQLENGRDVHLVDGLVRTNWLRTVGWSVRALLAVAMLVEGGPAP